MGQGKNGQGAEAAVAERPVDRLGGRLVSVTTDAGPVDFLIGKLSIDQWLGIAGIAVDWSAKMSPETRARFEQMRQGGEQDATTFQNIRTMLNPDTLLALYGVLIGGKVDSDELKRNFDIVEFMEVLDAADESNDLRRIWAPFSRVIARWRTSPQDSGQPS